VVRDVALGPDPFAASEPGGLRRAAMPATRAGGTFRVHVRHGRMTMWIRHRTSVVARTVPSDALVAHRESPGDAERSDQAMNAYAIFAVNEHLEFLLAEAAQRRMSVSTKPSLRQRIASVASSIKATLDAEADYSKSILPRLDAHRS
jgi:hypothetical protein